MQEQLTLFAKAQPADPSQLYSILWSVAKGAILHMFTWPGIIITLLAITMLVAAAALRAINRK